MSVEIEQMVTNCSVCADYAKKQPSEPLKPSVPPSLPWKKIGNDLFEFRREHYLLCVLTQQIPQSYKDGIFKK